MRLRIAVRASLLACAAFLPARARADSTCVTVDVQVTAEARTVGPTCAGPGGGGVCTGKEVSNADPTLLVRVYACVVTDPDLPRSG